MDAGQWGKLRGGYYAWDHGHVLLWNEWGNPEDRPLWNRRDEWVEEFGAGPRGLDAATISRNLCVYPNVYIMDQFSSQIRHFRPISVDQTEVTIYCIAPKGESAEARTARIRQYEDFFNASGMATPDDLEEFRSCQKTYLAGAAPWNDMSRGAAHWIEGPDDEAKELGLDPVSSGVRTEDEGLYLVQHGYWKNAGRSGGRSRRAGRYARRHGSALTRREPDMAVSLNEVEQFLYREARYLDDREFDKWLECYAPDAEFWMPAWDDDDTLVTDPKTEISLIYYNNRGGLEDRVFRIKTDRSSATSLPEPRTSHNISNVEIVQQDGGRGRGAVQLAHALLPLPEHRPLFRHVVLHASTSPGRSR